MAKRTAGRWTASRSRDHVTRLTLGGRECQVAMTTSATLPYGQVRKANTSVIQVFCKFKYVYLIIHGRLENKARTK